MTIPDEPTPIEPEPEPIPDVPGGVGPSDRSQSEIDADLEASFPSSDPPSGWAGSRHITAGRALV